MTFATVCLASVLSLAPHAEEASAPSAEPGATPVAESAAPADAPTPIIPEAGTARRVGGDLSAVVTRRGEGEDVVYRAGNSVIDTPLPVGYPDPTPPGAIDLKHYPSVRRAEVSGTARDDGSGFWPLFRHIQRRDIAMTSPVEMEYRTVADAGDPDAERAAIQREQSRWTMAFLYRKPEQGDTGTDPKDARVKILDTEPVLVLSVGMRGEYSRSLIARGERLLDDWLESQPDPASNPALPQGRWERAGEARAFYYNGPSLIQSRKWSEIQVPVRWRSAMP